MGNQTKIEWTDATWNPVIGCSKCSPGCANCYAERMAVRQTFMRPGCEYHGVVVWKDPASGEKWPQWMRPAGAPARWCNWNGKTAFIPERLAEPAKITRPSRIFVCSMGDLFHPTVTDDTLLQVFHVIAENGQHTFQLLTKRPERAEEFWRSWVRKENFPHVWMGATICNQAEASSDIPQLLKIPAAKHFVSVEPILKPVDLRAFLYPRVYESTNGSGVLDRGIPALDWVICGGETGPGARRMELDWARSLRDQCLAAGIPFFFKGVGTATLSKSHPDYHLLDGQLWHQFPEVTP